MRQLNGVFTQAMNKKHHTVGHLFQGRYKSILVDKQSYLLELSRYIVLNPVSAKMVDTPDEWLWSSWHCMVGKRPSPVWLATDSLLRCFGRGRGRGRLAAIAAYIQFVQEGVDHKIWHELKHQIFLVGDEAFVARYQLVQATLSGDLSEVPLKQRRPVPLSLAQYQQQSTTRNEAIVTAYHSGGYTMKQIGTFFNLHYSLVSRIIAVAKCNK